jgi:signal transduction histidine kinase
LKHGEPGQPIYVVARGEGEQATLRVHNLGPPIPTEVLPTIFEPFHHSSQKQRAGEASFGLGLYIVKEIVAAHGGTVDVSSSAAAGTTFIVRLPRGIGAHPEHHAP